MTEMYDPEKITYFGETDSRNKRTPFGIKAKDRTKHMYVIGKTGMGKSTLLENLAIQDIQNGNGIAFIDPHGGTAEKLLEYVPEERMKDVLYFAPFDLEHPVAFNVMEDVGADKRHLVVNGLMSTFEKIWVDAWSARMAYILNNTLLALLEYPGATLLGVNRMLSDKEYRKKIVDNVKDPSVKAFWIEEFGKYTEKFAAEATPAIQNKVGQFTANPLVRNLIGQSESTFDIRKIMDEKKILIVNLSKGRVGEGNANLIGSMLITKIYLAAMSRADRSEAELSKLPQFYLYVDEFQSFANKSFADILSEARKYKLNLTIAHQYIEQMEEEVRDAVFGNVGSMLSFRVGAFDAEVLEKEFAPTFTAEDLVNLGFTQIYLKLMIDGVSSQPFSATTTAPIKRPDITFKEEVIKYSREQFTKPRAEVEKAINDWHEEGRSGSTEVKAPPRERRAYDRPVEDFRKTTQTKYNPEDPRRDERLAPKQEDKREGRREERRAPMPIDIRGRKPDHSTAHTTPAFQPKPYVQNKEENAIRKEEMSKLPSDDFKPLSALSLKDIQEKKNNQRDPSTQHVNDLRSALSKIVKTELPKPAPTPKQFKEKTEEVRSGERIPKPEHMPKAPEPKREPEKPKEVPEDMLKRLLGVE
jgi:hypothetical protein